MASLMSSNSRGDAPAPRAKPTTSSRAGTTLVTTAGQARPAAGASALDTLVMGPAIRTCESWSVDTAPTPPACRAGPPGDRVHGAIDQRTLAISQVTTPHPLDTPRSQSSNGRP